MKKYLCMLLALLLLATVMTSCNGGSATAATDSESEAETESAAADVTYTVSLRSLNGEPFAQINFVVYKGEQMMGHGQTDANGSATVSLPTGNDYTLKLISRLPVGYTVQDSYALADTQTEIIIPSSVIADTDLTDVAYRLGDIMHDFTVTTVDGETVTLSQVLEEKKAVMLNFWFTNCGPCKSEFPHMQAAYAAQNSVEIIAMDDVGETTDQIKTFKENYGLTFPVVNEELGIGKAFHLIGYPTSVFIDRYGTICFIHVGGLSEAQFANAFAYFSAEDYTQTLFDSIDQIPEVN